MHVGHLRSTIIGESLCRVFEYLGHDVLRVNHLGDHGTAFGMLIAYLKEKSIMNYDITELTKIYKEAKKLFDADNDFKTKARLETFSLQQGLEENKIIWEKIYKISMDEFNKIYEILGTHAIVKGESFYQKHMENLVKEINLVDHEGMKIIYSSGKNLKGEDLKGNKHLIIVKNDGGFTYDTSDLAALRYRLLEEQADKIFYVVDIGQSSHFETLFSVAKDLEYLGDKQKVEYVGFGLVLGADGKKLKTRSGETIKLSDLLKDAYDSALKITTELFSSKLFDDKIISNIARKISINCIKYTDLSNPRLSDYKFDTKRMLNTKGNTAVYLMYAMARCKSILRKVDFSTLTNYEIKIDSKEARNLIFLLLKFSPNENHLTKFSNVLTKTYTTFSPHHLCVYLYDVVTALSKFYETNRCIDFDNDGNIRNIYEHRICLIHISNVIINQLFDLIGLEQIEQI